MEVPFTNLPKEQLYNLFSEASQQYVGQQFRVAHLTSEKGKTLNGKMCRVIGFTNSYASNPDMRLQCKITEGKPMLLKSCNLVHPSSRIMWDLLSASQPLSDSKIMNEINQALSDHSNNEPGLRRDLRFRIGLYRNLLQKLVSSGNGNALEEDAYCFPCGAAPPPSESEDNMAYMMRINKPGCVGNNKVDLRLMDLGLKGDGVATCSICNEVLGASETNLVTLPCVHQFHTACIQEWLSSDLGRRNWNCPTCRHAVPSDLSTYIIEYDLELQNRFKEFLLSGYCHKCILWVMEKDRNTKLAGLENEHGEMTMNQVGQTSEKVRIRPP